MHVPTYSPNRVLILYDPSLSFVTAAGSVCTIMCCQAVEVVFETVDMPPTAVTSQASKAPYMMWFWLPPPGSWNPHFQFSHLFNDANRQASQLI